MRSLGEQIQIHFPHASTTPNDSNEAPLKDSFFQMENRKAEIPIQTEEEISTVVNISSCSCCMGLINAAPTFDNLRATKNNKHISTRDTRGSIIDISFLDIDIVEIKQAEIQEKDEFETSPFVGPRLPRTSSPSSFASA